MSKSLNAFKAFKIEIELKMRKKINYVNSNYYGDTMKLMEILILFLFVRYFQGYGIKTSSTMLKMHKQIWIVERWNYMLMDMLKYMSRHSILPNFLLTNALKITMYILFNSLVSLYLKPI